MSVYSRVVRAVGHQRWFAAVASRVAPALDRTVYRLSRGRRVATPTAVPTFFLTTIGRSTGQERRVAVSYLDLDGSFIVVGTNWGKPSSPHWALNLLSNPQCWIERSGMRMPATASVVTEAERERLWVQLADMLPAFGTYRRRAASRSIHMFRVESVG
jgi:deazaflavin-dependent oxidoreductase (nitroreductase family)